MFPEKICVTTVMAHVAVKHIIGHKGQTGPVEEEKDWSMKAVRTVTQLLILY